MKLVAIKIYLKTDYQPKNIIYYINFQNKKLNLYIFKIAMIKMSFLIIIIKKDKIEIHLNLRLALKLFQFYAL